MTFFFLDWRNIPKGKEMGDSEEAGWEVLEVGIGSRMLLKGKLCFFL